MKIENNREPIDGLYNILNNLSAQIYECIKFYDLPDKKYSYAIYKQDYDIPALENLKVISKEFEVELNRLKVISIMDINLEEEKDFEEDGMPEKFEFEGLEDITEDELIKLNFLRLTTKEEVFNSYKEELEEKYNG